MRWGHNFALNGIERIILHPKTIASTLSTVIIFTGRPLPPSPFMVARGVPKMHQGISIHITESKIHVSYLKKKQQQQRFDNNVVFYYFYMSPLPTFANIIPKANNYSISSPFDVTKLQKIALRSHRLAAFHSQCQWTRIFVSFTNPMAMGTQFGFKRHREGHY